MSPALRARKRAESSGITRQTISSIVGRAAPVVVVGLHGDVVTLNPFHELERTGAHAARSGRAIILAGRLDGRRAGDGKHIHGQVGQEGRQRHAQDELDRVVVDLLDTR